MIDPKEKAKELFDKMKGFRVKHSHSKKCARIAVDEIIAICTQSKFIDYWNEVKTEIEKL